VATLKRKKLKQKFMGVTRTFKKRIKEWEGGPVTAERGVILRLGPKAKGTRRSGTPKRGKKGAQGDRTGIIVGATSSDLGGSCQKLAVLFIIGEGIQAGAGGGHRGGEPRGCGGWRLPICTLGKRD